MMWKRLHFADLFQLLFAIGCTTERYTGSLDGVHSPVLFTPHAKNITERAGSDIGLYFETLTKECILLGQVVVRTADEC